MATPAVAIRRLTSRVRAPDPEAAMMAGRLVEVAARRLGPPLEAALPGVLGAAGLDREAVVALPRLSVRLQLRGEVDAAELGAAWAEALARAILAALPTARRTGREAGEPGAAEPGEAMPRATIFADPWAAEAALLRAMAAGATLPWWAEAAGLDPARPGAAAALLSGWIARDPARAAARMVALIQDVPEVATALDAPSAARLARGFLEVLRALPMAVATPADAATAAYAAALPALLARLPARLRSVLAEIAADLRPPWIAATVLAQAPAWAPALPALLSALSALPAPMLRGTAPPTVTPAGPDRPPPAMPETRQDTAEVWCGGLLLLLRPVARLQAPWLALGEGLPPRLLALGLVALQRLAAPLPPAARRAALERDRPLLAVFAGAAPPEAPLDEAVLPPALATEAETALARLLAAAPAGIAHAPGALRRAYGRDPFAGDPATDALCRLLLRPGRLAWDEASAMLSWPADCADIALRRAGWDIDPGWVPWTGRRITFRYGMP